MSDRTVAFMQTIPTTLEDWKRLADQLAEAYEIRCNDLTELEAENERLRAERDHWRDTVIESLDRELVEQWRAERDALRAALDELLDYQWDFPSDLSPLPGEWGKAFERAHKVRGEGPSA